jgi:hypothetical protein
MAAEQQPAVTFRVALADDDGGVAMRRLAARDGGRAPKGLVAIADVDGEPVAAVGFADAHAVADPERAGPSVVAMLHLQRVALLAIGAIWGF